jgi:2-dehydro-3-deoxyphosphogluconate aldolase/(4S)-4-hydroxy-2-oxoglutarate aldolase
MDLQEPPTASATSARHRTLDALSAAVIVAVIRAESAATAVQIGRALAAGGISAIEVTFTVPGAAEAIGTLAQDLQAGRLPESVVLGAGTVVTAAQAQAAADAGAGFLVSPHTVPEVLVFARDRGLAVVPGAFSPGEVYSAHRQGGDLIKIFPAARLGPTYLRELHGPYPSIPLMPSGGVTVANVHEWLAAGAVALGVGSELVARDAVQEQRWNELTARAREFCQAVRRARQPG